MNLKRSNKDSHLQQARKRSFRAGGHPPYGSFVRMSYERKRSTPSDKVSAAANSNTIFYESLILAQDERWRRA